METSVKNKSFSSFLIPVFILTGFFVWGFGAKAEWANRLVFSEIQIAGVTVDDEFIELYNPTAQEINLTGYSLKKKAKTGTESAIATNSYFQDMVINPHNYLLLTRREYYQGLVSPGIEWPKSYSLSSDNTIILYSDQDVVVDKVGWGEAVDFEGAAFPKNPPAGQSLERKVNTNSTDDSLANGADKLLGNGWDSDDNSADFVLRTVSEPQNSQSSAEPALGNTPTTDLSSAPISPTSPLTTSAIKNIPTAEAGADKAAVVGELVEFDGSDSFDLAGKELTYGWTFGDGAKASGAAASHAYQLAGQYNATLKVDNGENTAEDSSTVKISEPEFSDKIIISEVLPNPEGADKDGEWIELANLGDKKLNLRGWILEAKTKTGAKRYVFQGDNFIEPKGFLLLKRTKSNLVLANTGGEVNLLFPPDKNLAKVSYNEAKEGKSYALVNNIWQWTDIPTPGKESIIGVADKTNKSLVEEKKSADAGADSSSVTLPENGAIADEEISSAPNSAGRNQVQNSAIQMVAFSDLEKYLGKAIGDKISAAVSGLVIKSAEPAEKISAPENSEALLGSQSAFAADENSEPVQQGKKNGAKNDPWFYSSLILSGLSLFLLWQYRELKKNIK